MTMIKQDTFVIKKLSFMNAMKKPKDEKMEIFIL